MSADRHPWIIGLFTAVALAGASLILFLLLASDGDGTDPGSTVAIPTSTTGPDTTETTGTTVSSSTDPTTASSSTTTTVTTEPPAPLHEWVDRRTVGEPWGDTVTGLLTFRGNPTNSFYGTGPIPETPERLWRYPDAPMCSQSTDLGTTSRWCGNGWTGQPVVWERADGVTEMIFGAYDRRLHFVNAATGEDTRASVLTGDIIKGSPTIDPDGYPLVYFGSRDNRLRILALDRGDPVELWHAEANLSIEGRWNDDWDASPRIVNDIMFEGAENGFFYIWRLNRSYDAEGNVTVAPELLFKMETYTDELLDAIRPSGYMAVSVEGSAAIFEGTVYFANSGGRVVGLDITDIGNGNAPIVFDYWVGDDVDAAIIVDEEGMLYVAAQYERYNNRAKELGQLIKLDPSKPDDPYVWGMFSLTEPPAKGGMWTTPALGDGVIYAVTNRGYLVVVDKETGEELWIDPIGVGSYSGPRHMSSPLVVDGHLILAIVDGTIRNYDLTDPAEPALVWEYQLTSGRIEATPAVWNGNIYVGSWDGYMYAVGEG